MLAPPGSLMMREEHGLGGPGSTHHARRRRNRCCVEVRGARDQWRCRTMPRGSQCRTWEGRGARVWWRSMALWASLARRGRPNLVDAHGGACRSHRSVLRTPPSSGPRNRPGDSEHRAAGVRGGSLRACSCSAPPTGTVLARVPCRSGRVARGPGACRPGGGVWGAQSVSMDPWVSARSIARSGDLLLHGWSAPRPPACSVLWWRSGPSRSADQAAGPQQASGRCRSVGRSSRCIWSAWGLGVEVRGSVPRGT